MKHSFQETQHIQHISKKWHVQICRPSSNISKHLNLSHQARGAGSEELRMPVEDLSWQICPVWVRVWNTFSGLKTIPGPSDRPGPEWTFGKYTCWQTPLKNSTVLHSLIIPGCFEHVLHLICYSYPVLCSMVCIFVALPFAYTKSFIQSWTCHINPHYKYLSQHLSTVALRLFRLYNMQPSHQAVTPGMSFRCLPRRAGCPGSSLT